MVKMIKIKKNGAGVERRSSVGEVVVLFSGEGNLEAIEKGKVRLEAACGGGKKCEGNALGEGMLEAGGRRGCGE